VIAHNIPNEEDEDMLTVALREAVRQGRIILTKDDKGRDVYTAVPPN